MPVPLEPALNAAKARGWRVLPGTKSAAARLKALRARLATDPRALDYSLDVLGREGGAMRTVERRAGVTFSPTATAEQEARSMALRRSHTPLEDTRNWAGELDQSDTLATPLTPPEEYGRRLEARQRARAKALDRPELYAEARRLLGETEFRKLLSDLGPTSPTVPEDIVTLAKQRAAALKRLTPSQAKGVASTPAAHVPYPEVPDDVLMARYREWYGEPPEALRDPNTLRYTLTNKQWERLFPEEP